MNDGLLEAANKSRFSSPKTGNARPHQPRIGTGAMVG